MALAVQGSFDDLGTPLSQVTFVVFDVETTGGSPASASLTEVAAARYRGGELLGTYQTFVRPDERIPPFITALTGISDAMVADAPRSGEMLPSFLEFLGGSVVVGHNVRFDLSFLNHALESTGRERLANATVDTLALARRLVRDMVPDCRLGTLASSLRLPHQPSHRALTDVLATGDLLHALLERAGTYGNVGLEELLDLPRLVGHPQAAKLRLTVHLPHRPSVYWFTDAAGHVLYVGKATDLHSRVRSYFSGDTRNKVGRLLRQMDAVHHRVCPGPLTAAVLEGRLIRSWAPPFNQQGKVRRRDPGTTSRGSRPKSGSESSISTGVVGAEEGAAGTDTVGASGAVPTDSARAAVACADSAGTADARAAGSTGSTGSAGSAGEGSAGTARARAAGAAGEGSAGIARARAAGAAGEGSAGTAVTDVAAEGGAEPVTTSPRARRRSRNRRSTWTPEDLEQDPEALLRPFAERLSFLSRSQRYEDAARVRDDAERLRHLIERHRSVESLRQAGRVVLLVDGEGAIELDGGILIETASLFDSTDPTRGGMDPAFTVTGDSHDNERIIVAQWLRAHAAEVRVLEASGTVGLQMPADRIPMLSELCEGVRAAVEVGPGVPAAVPDVPRVPDADGVDREADVDHAAMRGGSG